MKLKDSFLTQEVEDTQFLVPTGKEKFSGIVRGNATAAFIVNLLKTETTEDQIVEAMCREYDAPREQIQRDVASILSTLRSVGALAE